jgi:beta-1,4-mannosyltransferase
MTKKPLKVVHVPYSTRNPYQRLLGDNLEKLGVKIEGAQGHHLLHISFLNTTLLSILIRHRRPDIIHLHWHHSLLIEKRSRLKTVFKSIVSLLQLIFLKLLGIKLVWTVHNLKMHENIHRDLEKRFTKILAQLSDVIIAHCQTAKAEISKEFNIRKDHKIAVIPHGNFIDYYPNSISREEARNKLNLSGSKMTFLFLGEVRYYKGVLELIDAFQSLDSENVQLIIAGKPHDDKIADEIKARINGRKHVHTILKFIPDDELQVYINASDIMVYPYRDIFTSGGILLAMSFGKPVIAPCMGSITESLDNDGSFLYSSEEKDGLFESIKRSSESKGDLKKMGEQNFYLAKQFEWCDIARLTYDSYVKCMQENTDSQ